MWPVADVQPQLGTRVGKGEALWKSLFVTRGDVLLFMDADLTDWGPHFVPGLLGPLLTDPETLLVKGHYERLFGNGQAAASRGGRVTELVARPLINLRWPQLAADVQPLSGEWAIRRSLFESLPVPVGYGVELATLVDTFQRHGLDAIAQVDLGERGHRHQPVRDLAVIAAEIQQVADRRLGLSLVAEADERVEGQLVPFDRGMPGGWSSRAVPLAERPPAISVSDYRDVRACDQTPGC